ncbi:SDR family NAD(P)-dependent oxidoreductase [Oceanobacillus sp. CFH 90083]|uniref:SDR family NAD(P)-dependent oxidoreductase n=1 Tax=Oceanobacillus sp. CFH 90083 TaxID=2592336 RepID=UPI00128DB5A0|nr:SDR family oxidoreductase [Oceanobacillus sp. CFH 90083]
MRGIEGSVAIITGGAQGIGKATCDLLGTYGAKVVIADIDHVLGRKLEIELKGKGVSALYVHTDICNEDSIKNMVTEVVNHYNKIDFLVTSAGRFVFKSIDATTEEWRYIIDGNIIGTALSVKYVVPEMRKNGKGAIVNISSISGHVAQENYLTYNTTKAAVTHMTRCMAMDLANLNIRVNAVNPGTVWTKNNEYYIKKDKGLNREQADSHPDIGGAHMLKRNAEPEEIAAPIVFLLSDEASFITAENLMVDGGYTAK